MNISFGKFKWNIFYSPAVNWSIILFGIVLRLRHYFENRSLWLDEAYVALNILYTPFQKILYNQPIIVEQPASPLGFSILVKSFSMLLGGQELVLRLFPFLASLASIYLFYHLIRRVLSAPVIPIALFFFASCDALIHYGAELKPYATDAFFTLLLYVMYSWVSRNPEDCKKYLCMGLLGWVVIWFSFPGIILLASLGIVMFFQVSSKLRVYLLLIYIFWMMNVGLIYKVLIAPMWGSHYIMGTNAQFYIPAPVWTHDGFSWLIDSWKGMFIYPLGQSTVFLSGMLMLLGIISFWRSHRAWCFAFLLPLFFALVAACLKKYPFFGRHLLFLVPILIIFIGQGVYRVISFPKKLNFLVGILLLSYLNFFPVKATAQHVIDGYDVEQNRQVMTYLMKNYQEGDPIFYNTSTQYMFMYYFNQWNRKEDFLYAFSGKRGEVWHGLRVGKIGDTLITLDTQKDIAFIYEILLYDLNRNYTGKVFFPNRRSRMVQHLSGFVEDVQKSKRNWLILSHAKPELKKKLLDVIEKDGVIEERLELRGASIYLFRMGKK
ncbi:MAG: hypothetical protein KBD53_09645 [Candidatus Omnitrophica bacterium]|nr:hypothetical protein [Candidatus Omnitrophota bacterium]